MALQDVSLPKAYANNRVLFAQMLDLWRIASMNGFATVNLNLTQLGMDIAGPEYEFNNNGAQSLPRTIIQMINDIINGATPINGTTSNAFTINTDGNSATLSTVNLTADRVFLLPDESGTLALFSDIVTAVNTYVPIGSYLFFDDFNGTLSFPDSDIWHLCDGSTISDPDSPLDGLTPTDMSGRYLVGFGTDGGADIGDPGAMALVGNVDHQINIQHSHTVNSHNHNMDHGHGNNITATVPGHYHGLGTIAISGGGAHEHWVVSVGADSGGGLNDFGGNADSGVNFYTVTDHYPPGQGGGVYPGAPDGSHAHVNGNFSGVVGNSGGSSGDSNFSAIMAGGVTNFTGNTGSASPGTDAQLSATQSIQPHSVQVRIFMRKK